VEQAQRSVQQVQQQVQQVQQQAQHVQQQIGAQTQSSVETKSVLPPRVYIHIADEAQRAAAEALRQRLGWLRVGEILVSAPGVELVRYGDRSELRCFRREECGLEAKSLLDDINSLLETPGVVLSDLGGRYQQSTAIRPWHFELWFGPGPIALKRSP
jgi:hypothetical protein